MRRAWRCLLAVLIGMAALLVGLPAFTGAIPPTGACAHAYTYDVGGAPAPSEEPVTGRGPPVSCSDVTNYEAAGRRSSGSLARPNALTVPVTHDYDHVARLVEAEHGSDAVEKRSGSPGPGSAVAWRFDVATKLAPRQIDASWGGLIKYKHGGPMTAIEHINYRHAYTSGFSNVSKFSKGTSVRDIQGYVDDALRHGSVSADGTMVRHNMGRVIGTDQLGNPVSGIQMYVRNGQIQTAFPVAWP